MGFLLFGDLCILEGRLRHIPVTVKGRGRIIPLFRPGWKESTSPCKKNTGAYDLKRSGKRGRLGSKQTVLLDGAGKGKVAPTYF